MGNRAVAAQIGIVVLGVLAVLGGNAGVGRAQPSWLKRPYVQMTAGGFLPVGSLSDSFGGRWGGSISISLSAQTPTVARPFSLGVFYESVAVSRGVSSQFSDFYPRTADAFTADGGGVEGTVLLGRSTGVRPYFGGGVGVYVVKRKLTAAGNDFLEGAFSQNVLESAWRYTVGARAIVGAQIGRYFVTEARFLDAGSLDGVRFRGYIFSLSAHF